MYIDKCEIIPSNNGGKELVAIRGKCVFGGLLHLVIIYKKDFDKILNGANIQDVLHYISAADREFLITGVSPKEQLKLVFKKPENNDFNNIPLSELTKKKANWGKFDELLRLHGINTLYHFTDEENVKSIKESNGLLSAYSTKNNSIKVHKYASNELSREFDIIKGGENFIRLSFIKKHPMLYTSLKAERIKIPYIIEVSKDVVFFESTMFSNQNALVKGVILDGSIDNFKTIRFDLMRYKYLDLLEDSRSFLQAEILVKQYIPDKFIKNIYKLNI